MGPSIEYVAQFLASSQLTNNKALMRCMFSQNWQTTGCTVVGELWSPTDENEAVLEGLRVRLSARRLAGRGRIEVTGTGLSLDLPLNRHPSAATISCTC